MKKSFILRLSRFLVSGGLAVTAEYSSFLLWLQVVELPLVVANSLSYLIGLIVSFSLNRVWVFEGRERALMRQAAEYLLLAAVNLVVANALLVLLSHFIIVEIAKLLVMAVIAASNFIIFQKLIFRGR